MMEEWRDPIEPVEECSPLRRSFLGLLPDPLLGLWFGDPAVKRRAFESELRAVEDDVDSLVGELESVLDGEHYLTTYGLNRVDGRTVVFRSGLEGRRRGVCQVRGAAFGPRACEDGQG